MTRPADRWIRWTTTGCVALLALIAGTVSYLHMHLLVELRGQPGWVAALTPLSVDGMIVAASTTLLADSRAGQRGEPGRQRRGGPADRGRAGDRGLAIVRAHRCLRVADAPGPPHCGRQRQAAAAKYGAAGLPAGRWRYGPTALAGPSQRGGRKRERLAGRGGAVKKLRRQAWHWALAHRAGDGSLPSGRG